MGGSFVLKDADGRLAGYLMQGMDQIRCRMNSAGKAGEILLFDEGSACTRYPLDGSVEQSWRDGGRKIVGAVAVIEGRAAADSGAEARRMYERLQRREKRTTEPACAGRAEEAPKRETAPEKPAYSGAACSLPQRRWPPPACMPDAEYRGGQWTQESPHGL